MSDYVSDKQGTFTHVLCFSFCIIVIATHILYSLVNTDKDYTITCIWYRNWVT